MAVPKEDALLFLGCNDNFNNGRIEIASAILPLGKSIFDHGDIFIDLVEPLKSQWENNGELGSAYQEKPDGKIKVLTGGFSLSGLPFSQCENQLVEVSFDPFVGAEDTETAFDLLQFDQQGGMVGGARFHYIHEDSVGQGNCRPFSEIVCQ